jgi:hypothetical protein
VFITWWFDLLNGFVGQNRLSRHAALAELFQKAMAALQDGLNEFSAGNARDYFHGSQSRTGMGNVRAQHLGVISEDAAGIAREAYGKKQPS